jgi:glycosyltransferase involved in cell wall biosynthesis
MKIAYVTGVCVHHDAISNAVRDEICWTLQAGHTAHLLAYSCDHPDIPFTRVENEADVAFHPYFQSCDMAVFHFGVFYPLFNLLPIVPQRAKRIVVFHNITPKEFLPLTAHGIIDRSFAQMANIMFASHVVCDSETNLDVLHEAGIRRPSTVLPLAVHSDLLAPERKPSFDDGLARIAFLGRLVRSKGPIDLMEAILRVMNRSADLRLELNMIGNLRFSDQETVAEVESSVQMLERLFAGRIQVRIHGNAEDSTKKRILSEADMLVLPTYHEGFCVPILEALGSGCCIVTYDNSNTPAICGGMGTLVPTGDFDQLADAILDTLTLARSPEWKSVGYRRRADAASRYVEKFRPNVVKRRYLNFIENQER